MTDWLRNSMGYLSLPKRDSAEPRLSAAAFEQRCKHLAIGFSDVLGQARGEITFTPSFTSTTAIMSLAGRSSEYVNRNVGRPHRVVRMCLVRSDILAWVGYQENWRKQNSGQSFQFFDSGFTVHIGRIGELAKPQLLRSEWIGPQNSGFNNQAGHPHWQLDVLESARASSVQSPVSFDTEEVGTQDFQSAPASRAKTDELLGLTIERMHLASAALWWQRPILPIAHRAATVADLDRWVLGCVAYIKQEMGRCDILQVQR